MVRASPILQGSFSPPDQTFESKSMVAEKPPDLILSVRKDISVQFYFFARYLPHFFNQALQGYLLPAAQVIYFSLSMAFLAASRNPSTTSSI